MTRNSKNLPGKGPLGFGGDGFQAQPIHHPEELPPEILEMYPDGISRRRFLSLLSASAALAVGASCSRVDRGAIVPYTKRFGEAQPGVAAYYASTFQEGWRVEGVLVKTREGRPIHIEGNPGHPVSRGTVSLRAMGDLLGLYDPDRLRTPLFRGASAAWGDAVAGMAQAFESARSGGENVLLMTGAILSPSQKALIVSLGNTMPYLRHVSWEPASPKSAAGPIVPDFKRARVILSLQSDFLGNGSEAPLSIRDYASWRKVGGPSDPMNRLWVFEGPMTLTGANADERVRAKPSLIAPLAFSLVRLLNETHGVPLPESLDAGFLKDYELQRVASLVDVKPSFLQRLCEDLADAKDGALVLAGPSLPAEALAAAGLLNGMLGTENSGAGMDIPEVISNAELGGLLEDASAGKYASAVFWGANPAYAFPGADLWASAIGRIPRKFRIGLYQDETALDCDWSLPEHHWLESWGDFRCTSDYVSLRQPTIAPLHNTMQGEDILLECLRKMDPDVPGSYRDFIRTRWESEIYSADGPVLFEDFWNGALHEGGAPSVPPTDRSGKRGRKESDFSGAAPSAGKALTDAASRLPNAPVVQDGDVLELVLFPAAGVYDGRYANNGWLNELPDPVNKSTWGNPVSLSMEDAGRIGVENGDVVEVSGAGMTVETPVLVQPGQCSGVASIALGHGRRAGNVAAGIGVNAYPLLDILSGSSLYVPEVHIRRKSTGENREIPLTQVHDRMEGRDLARSWTRADYSRILGEPRDGGEANPHHHASLVPQREFPEHKWSMAVDLSACVGCSACVMACQSENNIAVVGPERVLKGRQMHWIRIDRYYEGDRANPAVIHQPVLCQHCDDAPCEIVCPVNATTHSPDGLNQMTYNRCVGTRYCSNNCPFKVRRFNFFDYTSMKKEPEILVFNPEVTVRPRGVMEKCTFCIQRIQNAKQEAKVGDRPLKDGDIIPACAGACPSGALVFGDLNDPESRVAKLSKANRAYKMLEELGVKPSVTYLSDISNPATGRGEA